MSQRQKMVEVSNSTTDPRHLPQTAIDLLRKTPTQDRSWGKVYRILAAAEELLGELGYAQAVATPGLLLERAGVTGGTFYEYFVTVESVMDVLSLTYIDRATVLAASMLSRSYTDWNTAAADYFDISMAFYQAPAAQELWLRGNLPAAVRSADEDSNAHGAAILHELLALAQAPEMPPACYRVAAEMADYLLRLAYRADARGDPSLVAEARHAFMVYLTARASESASAGSHAASGPSGGSLSIQPKR